MDVGKQSSLKFGGIDIFDVKFSSTQYYTSTYYMDMGKTMDEMGICKLRKGAALREANESLL